MAQQTINTGTAPNDGTGDTLKTSFTKCNANFTELYNGTGTLPYVLKAGDTMTGALTINAGGVTVLNAAGGDGGKMVGAAGQCQFLAQGASTDIALIFTSKGNSGVTFYNASFSRFAASFTSAPGSNTFFTATAFAGYSQIANNPAGNPIIFGSPTNAGFGRPQGRLTLQSTVPVMITTQSAKATVYYTPYVGDRIPIYDGVNWAMMTFAELSVATTDTTKSPAAIGASKVNDWFVWNDAGTLRLGHGPDWTNDTTRSAGTGLNFINGIWVNFNNITNGPNAARGTYVGTTRSNASSQLDWIYGTAALGGGQALLNIWNTYNRVDVGTTVIDTTTSWSSNGVIIPMDNSLTNRVSAVFGLAEDAARVDVYSSGNCNANQFAVRICLNSAVIGGLDPNAINTIVYGNGAAHNATSAMSLSRVLGFNFWQAMDHSGGPTSTNSLSVGNFGLAFHGRM